MKNIYYGYIYKIKINNIQSSMHDCYYIGQHKHQTYYKDSIYYGSGALIKKYIKRWGFFGLNKEILFEAKTREELDEKEKFYINELYKNDSFIKNGKCLNLCSGGSKNKEMSFESKIKMSKSHKNKKVSDKTKNKIKNSLTGKFKGENSFAFGYHHSEEAKKKIAVAQKGKVLSEDTKMKLRVFHTNRSLSEYHKKQLRIHHADFKGKNNPVYGKRWFNDGKTNCLSFDCPEGFKPGMIKRNKPME